MQSPQQSDGGDHLDAGVHAEAYEGDAAHDEADAYGDHSLDHVLCDGEPFQAEAPAVQSLLAGWRQDSHGEPRTPTRGLDYRPWRGTTSVR